jgi:hypothetical protein
MVKSCCVLLMSCLALMPLPLLPASKDDLDKNVLRFLAAFNEGADCPRLFELRNEAKRRGATEEQQSVMNTRLRAVKCFSATSHRQALGAPRTGTFTVREYRIYHESVNVPMLMTEEEVLKKVAKKYGTSVGEVRSIIDKVQHDLVKNDWMVSVPEVEIRHASDWDGEQG